MGQTAFFTWFHHCIITCTFIPIKLHIIQKEAEMYMKVVTIVNKVI